MKAHAFITIHMLITFLWVNLANYKLNEGQDVH
jgi:hypothetical protein